MGPGKHAEYLDFDLLLSSGQEGRYVGRVIGPLTGGDVDDVVLRLPELEELRLAIASPGAGRTPPKEAARRLGSSLFTAVFSGRLGALLRSSMVRAEGGAGVRLRLWLGTVPELARLPWEYLYDETSGRYLGLSIRTPIVRYPDVAEPHRPLWVEPPLRFLAVLANPPGRDPLEVETEWRLIQEALASLVAKGRVILERLQPATSRALVARLRGEPVHVLHFVGHGKAGSVELEHGSAGGQALSYDELSNLLGDHRSLRLVVLNACEGACASASHSFSGAAQALMQKRIPAVVAMQFEIDDEVGLTFARSFYGRIAAGDPVDRAVTEARKDLSIDPQAGMAWGAPVLYLRSDGVLFRLVAARIFRGIALAVAALLLGGFLWFRHSSQKPTIVNPPECPAPPGLEMTFVRIEPGSFLMGSNDERKSYEEGPAHQVTLTRPFCLGAAEVTQAQWEKVMGKKRNDSRFRGPDLPVQKVTWDDAQEFLRSLEKLDPGAVYRLPTEAEWEYAARAGSALRFGFADHEDDLARHGNCSNKVGQDGYDGPSPVGRFRANPWGLQDMQGNVWEWVEDWYGPYEPSPQIDPPGPAAGKQRVRRGGSFDSAVDQCRPGRRTGLEPDSRHQDVGFRVVREIRGASPQFGAALPRLGAALPRLGLAAALTPSGSGPTTAGSGPPASSGWPS